MSIVDLHPEELIDKWVRGNISDEERARLSSHLDTCAVCRFELSVRRDLAKEFQEASVRQPGGESAGPPSQGVVRGARRHRSTKAVVMLAAAALLAAGGALGAVVTGAWIPFSRIASTKAPSRSVGSATATSPTRTPENRRSSPTDSRLETTPAVPSTAPRRQSAPARAPEPPSPPPLEPQRRPLSHPQAVRREDATPREPAWSEPAYERIPAERGTGDTELGFASDAPALFAEANRERRKGNVDRAVALYGELQRGFPDSAESKLSRATLARLMLDVGEAEAALQGFEAYLSGEDAVLGAEALVGRAVALQRLGRTDEEIRAWRAVLREFPESVHGRRAAKRLLELDAP